MNPVPPRIYGLPAAGAPVVAVFRRGPSDWAHVGRWDLEAGVYEPGAWLRGRLFPRRSDLSPDGRLLCYFAHKAPARWPHGDAYVAVSRLPWLTALHAFGTCGTWTRGYHFVGRERCGDEAAESLQDGSCLLPTPAVQFASERRRGWEEAPDSPPRVEGDPWDSRRNARLRRPRPGGGAVLHVGSLGVAGGELGRDQAVDGMRVEYRLERDGVVVPLAEVQWADWSGAGDLLVATRSGRLQRRSLSGSGWETRFDHDLAGLEPDPRPSPSWAKGWQGRRPEP
jgi:hypothetical protein